MSWLAKSNITLEISVMFEKNLVKYEEKNLFQTNGSHGFNLK